MFFASFFTHTLPPQMSNNGQFLDPSLKQIEIFQILFGLNIFKL